MPATITRWWTGCGDGGHAVGRASVGGGGVLLWVEGTDGEG